MMVSLTELEQKVAPCGKLGEYLFRQLVEFNDSKADQMFWPSGESWTMGDSVVIGIMMNGMYDCRKLEEAPHIDQGLNYHFDGKGRKIVVYHDIDQRFILEDMYCKLRRWAQEQDQM